MTEVVNGSDPINREEQPAADDVGDGMAVEEGLETNENGVPEDDKKFHMTTNADSPWSERIMEVFMTFWPLGLVAFGGPQAHVAILRDHLVVQRDWLDEEQFTELFAIGQVCLPAEWLKENQLIT